jgi:hypothetical protein
VRGQCGGDQNGFSPSTEAPAYTYFSISVSAKRSRLVAGMLITVKIAMTMCWYKNIMPVLLRLSGDAQQLQMC